MIQHIKMYVNHRTFYWEGWSSLANSNQICRLSLWKFIRICALEERRKQLQCICVVKLMSAVWKWRSFVVSLCV